MRALAAEALHAAESGDASATQALQHKEMSAGKGSASSGSADVEMADWGRSSMC